MHVQVARYSLVMPMIENRIEHEIVANSVVTFSKLSKSPHANCQTHTYFSHEEKPIIFRT